MCMQTCTTTLSCLQSRYSDEPDTLPGHVADPRWSLQYFKQFANRMRVSASHWLSKRSCKDVTQTLLKDLAFNPRRYESWFQLGVLCRARADFMLSTSDCDLDAIPAEQMHLVSELRMQSLRCFNVALVHCKCEPEDRETRAHAVLEMSLHILAATRLVRPKSAEQQELLQCARVLVERAKEV
jgi:hypothetical protein